MSEILDVINENDEVIGQESREEIHKKGLLHRGVWVWVFNNNNEVILQQRSNNKDHFPGLLAASATGHVSVNEKYSSAAINELKEELGLSITNDDLILLGTHRIRIYDNAMGVDENVLRNIYAYNYNGTLDQLNFQKSEIDRLVFWPINKLLNTNEETKKLLVPDLTDETTKKILRKIKQLINN